METRDGRPVGQSTAELGHCHSSTPATAPLLGKGRAGEGGGGERVMPRTKQQGQRINEFDLIYS